MSLDRRVNASFNRKCNKRNEIGKMFELYGLQRKGTKKKFFLNKLNPIKMVFYLKSENYESKTLSSELIQIVIPFIHKRHGIFFYSLNHVKMHLSCTRIGVALSLCVFFLLLLQTRKKRTGTK